MVLDRALVARVAGPGCAVDTFGGFAAGTGCPASLVSVGGADPGSLVVAERIGTV
jgi:hypothetical protein